MPLSRIENTNLWKRAFNILENDPNNNEKQYLCESFRSFREKTEVLLGQIHADFNNLTNHNIEHADALWEISDLLCGDNIELNPLETFVLGGAFLIHDAAISFASFKNGKEELRNTIAWLDNYHSLNNSDIIEREKIADFMTIRFLHGEKAKELLNMEWGPEDKKHKLLEKTELVTHLGDLIGRIAASHNWDIEKVEKEFTLQFNPPIYFPRDWVINPLKLACIIRCADALHIDNERAPDFLFALLKRSGLSLDHWKGQNKLAKAAKDRENSELLLFTSSLDFKESDSNAWFVIYDSLCIANKEIRGCNKLLENSGDKKFSILGIRGVESPEEMNKYIKTQGWIPSSTKIHVSNLEKIITSLGGENLYGQGSDYLEIVIRELIQNARDAIFARKSQDDDFLDGKINVSLEDRNGEFWLVLEDNGIGMTDKVLTEILLDFGTSFWSSELVKHEFPGLISSKFRSLGKYGIGFYSVFMIAEQVLVSSRRFDKGLEEIMQLKFLNGLSLRPLVVKGKPNKFSSMTSTKIELKLKREFISKDFMIKIKTNMQGMVDFSVPLEAYVATICGALDVPVFFKNLENKISKVHIPYGEEGFCPRKWLEQISFCNFHPNKDLLKKEIEKYADHLEPIFEDDTLIGYAAIAIKNSSIKQDFLSLITIDKLPTSIHSRDGDFFVGFIDYKPRSAKRDPLEYRATEENLKRWSSNQKLKLQNVIVGHYERYLASTSLCRFKEDPIDFAVIPYVFEGKIWADHFDSLADQALSDKIVFLSSGHGLSHMETWLDLNLIIPIFNNGEKVIWPMVNSPFLSLDRENNIPKNNFSILDCLYRKIEEKGYCPELSFTEKVPNLANILGHEMGMLTLRAKKI